MKWTRCERLVWARFRTPWTWTPNRAVEGMKSHPAEDPWMPRFWAGYEYAPILARRSREDSAVKRSRANPEERGAEK